MNRVILISILFFFAQAANADLAGDLIPIEWAIEDDVAGDSVSDEIKELVQKAKDAGESADSIAQALYDFSRLYMTSSDDEKAVLFVDGWIAEVMLGTGLNPVDVANGMITAGVSVVNSIRTVAHHSEKDPIELFAAVSLTADTKIPVPGAPGPTKLTDSGAGGGGGTGDGGATNGPITTDPTP